MRIFDLELSTCVLWTEQEHLFSETELLLSGALCAAEHSRNSGSSQRKKDPEGSCHGFVTYIRQDLALLFSPALPPELDHAFDSYRKSCLVMAAAASLAGLHCISLSAVSVHRMHDVLVC